MSNYGLEYKNYYEGLKNKSPVRVKTNYSTVDDYLPMGGSTYGYNSNRKKEFNILNYVANMITLQLVGTIMMFLFVFGAKYSNSAELDKYYSYLKEGINKKVTYSDIKSDIQAFKMSDLVDEVKGSVKWVKDKIESNPIN